MASATKIPSSVSGTDSLHNKMCFIEKFQPNVKKDHIHEEKVVHFDGKVLSQRAILTRASERTAANEPTSNNVLKEDLLCQSKILDEGTEELNLCSTDKIRGKSVSRRILEEDFLERYADQRLPSTQFRALKFQGRTTKHSVGTRPLQRNNEMLEKTDEGKIVSCLRDRKFEASSEDKFSTEAERMEKSFFKHERGNRDMKSQDVYGNLSWSPSPPVLNKRKGSGTVKKEPAQQKVEKNNKQLKMVVNNLVSAVSYSFQNALALKQQQCQEIDKSFLTFFLRREARKMFLIKELIKQLDAITASFKSCEPDLKDISETVESLHSLMCQDLKDPNEEEISSGGDRNYLQFITTFAIIVCVMIAFGSALAFIGNWSDLIALIILVLMFFLMIRQLLEVKSLIHKD